jgi:hypothetical protein
VALDQDRSRVLASLRNRQEEQPWPSRRRSMGCVTETPHHASLTQRVGSGIELDVVGASRMVGSA